MTPRQGMALLPSDTEVSTTHSECPLDEINDSEMLESASAFPQLRMITRNIHQQGDSSGFGFSPSDSEESHTMGYGTLFTNAQEYHTGSLNQIPSGQQEQVLGPRVHTVRRRFNKCFDFLADFSFHL